MDPKTLYPGLPGDCFISDLDELSYKVCQTYEHPVMRYVRELPFEETAYPANKDHGVIPCPVNNKKEGREDPFLLDDKKHRIVWTPPAHDEERSKAKGCGFVHSPGTKGAEGIMNYACSDSKEHFIHGVMNHCWSLTCPVCCNDTALRMGERVEEQLMTYRYLKEKQGQWPGGLGHWVVSPVQDDIRRWMQTEEDYSMVRNDIAKGLMGCGCFGGVNFFHPWRQKEERWEWMPHFHLLAFGFIDTDKFLRIHDGWVIKKVHAGQEIESIKHTAAYLATHMGMGLAEIHADEIDWESRFLNHMLPGLMDESSKRPIYETVDGFRIRTNAFRWNDDDLELRLEGRGRMCGEIDIDWLEWTKDALFKRLRIQYFGEVNQNNIRKVATEKENRIRVCKKCGSPINLYERLHECKGEEVSLVFNNDIRAFRKDAKRASEAIKVLRPMLAAEGTSVGKVIDQLSLVVSKDELNRYKERERKSIVDRDHNHLMNNDDRYHYS